MKINEFQKPQISPRVVDSVVARLQNIMQHAAKLPNNDPARALVHKLVQTLSVGHALDEATASEQAIVQSIISALQSNPAQLQALLKSAESAIALSEKLAKQIVGTAPVQQAFTAHNVGIELDTKGDIVRMDKELEQYAQNIAKKLNLSLKWTRNLIGMFGMEIDRADKIAFLKACNAGTALDIPRMMKAKTGKLEDFITRTPPTIQQVFNNIKGTLLDISLSSGQGAATGPFEAMLAIMGGAQKAAKGDLLIDGKKFEVKSASVSVGAKSSNSNAWLDAGGEIAPAKIRELFVSLVTQANPRLAKDPDLMKADFRPNGLPTLARVMQKLGKNATSVMFELHTTMFPSISEYKGYDFIKSLATLIVAIEQNDSKTIAKEQGIMAMMEYAVGEYDSGFILYNSSFQTFRIIVDAKDIIAMAKNPEAIGVNFESKTVTMGTGRKSSPGIYFGPLATSPEGKTYTQSVRASDDWQQKYAQGLGAREEEAKEHGEEFIP